MAESMPEDMWTPYKHLYSVVEKSLTHGQHSKTLPQLEAVLRKHTQNFINILRNPPKNATSRSQIKQGLIDGVNIPGTGNTILSKDLVDECLILSDMYDLEEYIALELLCTAQQQMYHHPGLPRGLVAVLLYYDGRKALALALRDLFQARSGISWCTEAPDEIIKFITLYTNDLVENSNILNRIIELLEQLDISKELEILASNRALGPPKHHRQILDIFEDIRLALATAIFNWSAQCGLPKLTTLKLIDYLKTYKPTEPRGGMDDVTTTLLMALLYSFDISVLQKHEDGERIVQDLPIIKDAEYSQDIYDALKSDRKWDWDDKIKSIAVFGFGLAMTCLRQAPQNLQENSSEIIEKDEQIIDDGIRNHVFDFIHCYLLESKIIFRTEFFFRRVHAIFTDFIEHMHSKITELRGKADETARTVQCYIQQGIDPPVNLDHSFESLMLAVGKFYSGDELNLCLSLEYWGPMDIPTNYQKTSSRSVSLFKFLRSAGEVLPPILFVPYLKMLAGLSSCEQSARNTFNLLKQGSNSATLSWDHFFGSLDRYYANLRQEHQPRTETVYRSRVLNRCIKPVEIEGLHAVFDVIRAVAKHDEVARAALCEHPNWATLHILLGLLSCSVPITLKSDILLTLATLAKSKDNAIQLWNNLESSQIITTLPTTSAYSKIGLEAEIEQIESRNETYPLSKAVLEFLYELSKTVMPKNLGGGNRKPGLTPYLTFLIEKIFLKFYSRNYKNVAEKWEVGEKCLKIFDFYIREYFANPSDFVIHKEENPPPGFTLMYQMHTYSEMLQLILYIIDEARSHLDTYAPFAGKLQLEQCTLHCLNIIKRTLDCQNSFFEAHSIANSSAALSGLNKLLLDMNSRSGKPDHILNITKFVTYNNWLPMHALVAIKILKIVCKQPKVNLQILGIFTQDEKIQNEIRHGFVECLESEFQFEIKNELTSEFDEVDVSIKEVVLNLLQECLAYPSPNVAHYLLGFDITKDINITQQMQRSEILNFSSTCTRSLVTILDNNLELMKMDYESNQSQEKIIDKSYRLLYTLCFNYKTSEIILRFLRTSCNDFLCRHISALPFKNYKSSLVLSQMSNLMKCAAIELKITAENNQFGQFLHLCKILLGVSQNNAKDPVPLELSYYYPSNIQTQMMVNGSGKTISNAKDEDIKLLLCYLLDCIDLESKSLNYPKWNYFDNSLMKQIFKECEIKNGNGNGSELINIKKLHDILYDELNIVQNTIATGQRQLILQEIESILEIALKLNEQKRKCFSTVKFMESWGQVTQILFSVAPIVTLPFDVKEELLLKILQCLLNKVVPVQVILEIANISSATILLLLVNLRCCYNLRDRPYLQFDNKLQINPDSQISTVLMHSKDINTYNTNTIKSSTLNLKYILKNIVEWIIVSGVASQNLRINLYASLLNFMYIVKKTFKMDDDNVEDNEQYVSRLDRSMFDTDQGDDDTNKVNQIQMTVEIFSVYGDKLIDILCHDCIGGHDVCKMLALCCIDTLLELDSLTHFIYFIEKRGYLTHIVDSLIKSDESLCSVLNNVPDSNSMRSLYVYESKMAMLNRIASSQIGAEMILEQKILGILSNMKVYDLHPDFHINYMKQQQQINLNLQIPPIDNRYQQIIFPALSLCNIILTTLGSENYMAISHIMHFLLSHGDTIEIVLRAGTPSLDLGLLEELSGITGLIARTTNQAYLSQIDNTQTQPIGVQMYRLQRLIIALFPRFLISEEILKTINKPENSLYESNDKNGALHLKYILEIASNILLYCRNFIANHSSDHRTTTILFVPTVVDPLQGESKSGNVEISPSLGMVIEQLKNCVMCYNKQKPEYDNLIRQKTSIEKNNLVDTSAWTQYHELVDRLNNKRTELGYYTFITEHCLYLIWTHLDFYMRKAVPMNILQTTVNNCHQSSFHINDLLSSSSTEAGWKITSEDVSKLKKSLVLIFNETFCKQLVQTACSQAASDKGFIEALLRRIKCLIQFVPVN